MIITKRVATSVIDSVTIESFHRPTAKMIVRHQLVG
jgi:hypothetical protein